jgi:hypothetical protein
MSGDARFEQLFESSKPATKPKSADELAAEFLRDTYCTIKARPTAAAKIQLLEALREQLAAFDIRVDNLIAAWRDKYFETKPRRKRKCLRI